MELVIIFFDIWVARDKVPMSQRLSTVAGYADVREGCAVRRIHITWYPRGAI